MLRAINLDKLMRLRGTALVTLSQTSGLNPQTGGYLN